MEKNYLILAHSRPEQLSRLVHKLDDGQSKFYIHIDLKCDINPFREKLTQTKVVFLENRVKCIWGDISLIKATVLMMRAVLQDKRKGYCILLSGQDYPIKSNQEIDHHLADYEGCDFIDLVTPEMLWPEDKWRKRIEHYKFNFSEEKNDLVMIPSVFDRSFYTAENRKNAYRLLRSNNPHFVQIFKKRKFPKYFKPYAGPQWWALTTETIEKLLQFIDNHPDYYEHFHFTFCSDELLLQSILQHYSDKGSIKIKPGLHFVNWDKNFHAPKIFTTSDFPKLALLPEHPLFARKFDMEVDSLILDDLDNFISKDEESKIKIMNEVSNYKPVPIISSDYNLLIVNDHTFINALTPQSTVVDLGGNKGDFSKLVLKLFSCENLYIVEGNPQLIPLIEKNIAEYSENVKIIEALIGPEYTESVDFHISDDPESSLVNRSLNNRQNFVDTIQVEMITMNKIYEHLGDRKIDLLKVDIEGMEWEVLKKFTSRDYEKIEQITVEFHDFLDPTLVYKTEEVKSHLVNLGYIYVKGNYPSASEYYDCLFCKPHLHEKYLQQKVVKPNYQIDISMNQRYINQEVKIVKINQQHEKEIIDFKNSLSWKITAPIRALASFIGYK